MKSVLEYIVLAGRGNKSESIIAWVEKEVSALSFLQLMTSKYIPKGKHMVVKCLLCFCLKVTHAVV